MTWPEIAVYKNKFTNFDKTSVVWLSEKTRTRLTHTGADPGFLDWGFKLAEGVRFVQFDQFFLNFPMKMK